ncbi:MAG: TIGR02147 family protein [Chitinivibrionales bacterium]|nr:TIGR02147 family protein [Chitinivibrionales bacterium]
MGAEKINIFIYLEYRKYLSDYYALNKSTIPSFSFRYFSQKAGLKTPNFLQLLIQGKRNLKYSTISRISQAIGHSAEEARYFELLVFFDQAGTVDEKAAFFSKLSEARRFYRIEQITDLQLEHFQTWYHKAVRELIGFYPFNEKEKYAYRKLAACLSPAISESQARASVKLLLKLGLLTRNANNAIVQSERFISTGDEVNSLFVRKFHQVMIDRARESLDRFAPSERDISSLTVSMSAAGFALLKQEIQLFRKRLLELVKTDTAPGGVYQVNFQFFPLTNKKKIQKGIHNHERAQ